MPAAGAGSSPGRSLPPHGATQGHLLQRESLARAGPEVGAGRALPRVPLRLGLAR